MYPRVIFCHRNLRMEIALRSYDQKRDSYTYRMFLSKRGMLSVDYKRLRRTQFIINFWKIEPEALDYERSLVRNEFQRKQHKTT